MKIFFAAAQSIMFYAVPIWGYREFEQTEKLFTFFIKKMLTLPTNTPNYAIYLETRYNTQFSIAFKLHLSYIIKVLNMSSSRLPKMLAKETINRKISWYDEWLSILSNSDLPLPSSTAPSHLKECLTTAICAIENSKIEYFQSSAKSSTFHDCYSNLIYDGTTYFVDSNSCKAISYMFKARTGLLDINARAFKKNTVGLCSLCNLDAVENTHHFLGECPIYKNARLHYFGLPALSTSELYTLLNSHRINDIYNYICYALNYRKLLLTEFA